MSQFTDDLLAQADGLLNAEPRRPKQASLRRAVSAAYYALFHFLIEESAIIVVGTAGATKPLRQLIDYDLSQPFTRDEAEALIAQSRVAVENWNRLKTNDRELAKFYALCLQNWNNWKGRG